MIIYNSSQIVFTYIITKSGIHHPIYFLKCSHLTVLNFSLLFQPISLLYQNQVEFLLLSTLFAITPHFASSINLIK